MNDREFNRWFKAIFGLAALWIIFVIAAVIAVIVIAAVVLL